MYRGFMSTFSGFGQKSAIDELLENENPTLDQVLEENETVNEIKVNNK